MVNRFKSNPNFQDAFLLSNATPIIAACKQPAIQDSIVAQYVDGKTSNNLTCKGNKQLVLNKYQIIQNTKLTSINACYERKYNLCHHLRF